MPPVKVSVCIPTYNGAVFVAQALESVLAQTLTDFELIIVDDCSTDATLEVVRGCVDTRLRVIENSQRLGIPGNWNRCLATARGEYLCVFHQDDIMLSHNLERKVQMLDANPAIGFVHSAVEVMREGSAPQPLGDWVEDAQKDFVQEGAVYFRKLLLGGDCVCAPAVVARRERVMELGGFDEDLGYACDYAMWMKLCVSGKVGFVAQPLIQYRWHQENASHAYRFERGAEECQIACERAVQYYGERTDRREESAALQDAVLAVGEWRGWAAELERGKAWLEDQRQTWQRTAEEREEMLREQRGWVEELEKGKAWLEEQRQWWQAAAERWQAEAEQRASMIMALERGKAWVEHQWRFWQESAWGRLGVRLGVLKHSAPDSGMPEYSKPRSEKQGNTK
jgi:hypothetical protein